jgi:hypothetical protein
MHLADVPACGEIYRRCRAVSLLDSLVLTGHGLQRLVPRYTLELAFASLSHSFQRVKKPVRSIYPLPICPAPEAVPELRLIAVVCLQACNHTILNMHFQQTGSAAIHVGPDIVSLFFTSHSHAS